jgi:hypothetical protein
MKPTHKHSTLYTHSTYDYKGTQQLLAFLKVVRHLKPISYTLLHKLSTHFQVDHNCLLILCILNGRGCIF